MPEVNFNLLAPTADLYSGPQVQMDPVAAYEKAKATRQSNMLAQLYAKHYDPQTGGVNYNALIPEAAQSGLDVSQLMPGVREQQENMASIAQKRALQQQEEATAAAKQQEIDQAKMKQLATESYGRFRSVKNADDLLAWHLANPELPGTNKAERTARLQAQLAQPGGYEAARSEIEAALQDITGIKPEKVTETDLAKLIREQKDYKPNSPEWKAYQRKIDEASGGLTAYQTAYLAHLAEQEKRLSTPATGGGKTTVSQEQANYNVNRLLNAANQITAAMTAEEGVQKPGLKEAVVKGTFPSLTGAVQSGQRQIVDAAQTDMLDALLYLSTGAAYNKEQLEGQKKSYLPSFLDKPETVAAKQQRLITLIQDAKTRAGNAWTPDMDKKMDLILSSFKAAGTQPAAGGSNIPTVTTQKQYDALPKGAQFYEDGKLYRKP